jgi:hypothetical protein
LPIYPQQPVEPEHPHSGCFPRLRLVAALIMAAAQPTPACTDRAPGEQLRWQAPHSMQESRLTIWARWSAI